MNSRAVAIKVAATDTVTHVANESGGPGLVTNGYWLAPAPWVRLSTGHHQVLIDAGVSFVMNGRENKNEKPSPLVHFWQAAVVPQNESHALRDTEIVLQNLPIPVAVFTDAKGYPVYFRLPYLPLLQGADVYIAQKGKPATVYRDGEPVAIVMPVPEAQVGPSLFYDAVRRIVAALDAPVPAPEPKPAPRVDEFGDRSRVTAHRSQVMS
jgi:hypothetical protein